MLLPVADLTDSTVKILRVPPEKGAGAIDTEFRFASDAVDLGRGRFWQDPITAVGAEASQITVDTVRKYYPVLRPRVDINDIAPHCWNKEGQSDSLDRFLRDPLYKLM